MDILDLANNTLRRVATLTTSVGLRYVDLPDSGFSVGIAVAFSDQDYVLVSVVGGGDEHMVYFSCGILMNVDHDEVDLLRACNRLTRDRPSYAVYLHEAQIGWDVLMTTAVPVSVLEASPAFYRALLEGLPAVARETRDDSELKVHGGAIYNWTEQDLKRLLLCSTL